MDNPDPTQFISILAHKAVLVDQQSAFDAVIATKQAELAAVDTASLARITELEAELAAARATPPTPEPETTSIRAWQAKAVLQLAGLLEPAEAIIDALDEPQRTVVLSAWNNNADFSRNSPTIAALGAALGLTDDQLDAMFAEAAALTV